MCSTTIPSSFYEAKRKLRALGLGYETIHACKYDYVLYWKEFVDLQHCHTCGEARSSSQQPATPTPRRCAQSRLLELQRHVAINGRIPMTIAPRAEKPIFPHVVRFSQAISVCRLFVLDFNDQAMNRFVEHQMLTNFKEFQVDYHRHFKKYSDSEEARANPPNALVERHED
ncbi:CACTA en-spm transposon protein [Cucumis melo var. makuwa]|uniref:CACTA en-spm transposon protein n=1 Tax=Cucumis melo var. makuwa TaxID=1194695 RepID=A0A5D3CBV2_CUCMM|nr:CACTA en-spm transposon protein [Cucumis melo var. makuwa]